MSDEEPTPAAEAERPAAADGAEKGKDKAEKPEEKKPKGKKPEEKKEESIVAMLLALLLKAMGMGKDKTNKGNESNQQNRNSNSNNNPEQSTGDNEVSPSGQTQTQTQTQAQKVQAPAQAQAETAKDERQIMVEPSGGSEGKEGQKISAEDLPDNENAPSLNDAAVVADRADKSQDIALDKAPNTPGGSDPAMMQKDIEASGPRQAKEPGTKPMPAAELAEKDIPTPRP